MQRVCFPANRFLHAIKGAAEFALDNFGRRVVGWRYKARMRWPIKRRATATKWRRK
jgi:hypothetical protein